MKKILILATLFIAIFLTSSFDKSERMPIAPSFEMYGFIKESPSFRQAIKGAFDELCQSKVNAFNPATTDPSELAQFKFAKAILQEGANGKAFSFALSELFTGNYCGNLNDFQQTRNDLYTALDSRFVNLADRWSLN